MILSDHQAKFTKDKVKFMLYALSNFTEMKFVETEIKRWQERHRYLLKKGYSQTKDTMHFYALACDIVMYYRNRYLDPKRYDKWPSEAKIIVDKLGRKWEAMDERNRWGGKFKNFFDPNHIERYVPEAKAMMEKIMSKKK